MTNNTVERTTPDVAKYMELAKSGDIETARKYLIECFGEGDDMDKEAIMAFQKEVEVAVADELNAKAEATEDKTDEATTEVQEAETDSETTN